MPESITVTPRPSSTSVTVTGSGGQGAAETLKEYAFTDLSNVVVTGEDGRRWVLSIDSDGAWKTSLAE